MNSSNLLRAICCVTATFVSAGLTCAGPAPSLLQTLAWRSIGPFRGGRVLAITGVPHEPDHFYFGAVNGGVWETKNAGRTWTPIFDAAQVGSIGALAVAPSDPKILYVGTGESDMRSNIAQGEGVFKSVDAGRTWQRIGLEDSRQIGRILVDPRNSSVLLVAALGHPYGASDTRGVYRSADGGRTWQRTLHKDSDTGAIDLAAAPSQPDVVYAALWQTRRPPWSVYPPASGPGGGLYKSVDGGKTWAALAGRGLPAMTGRIGLAVSPSAPRRVYALIDAVDAGLYRSDDAGSSWSRVSDDKRIWGRGWYFGGVTVDPTHPDVVYICNTAVYRSTDAGKSFVPIKGEPGGDDYHQLWIDPTNPQRRALAVDQGALITVDAGATWSSWFNQPIGQFYHVATDNRFPYWVYGAQQDSGAAGIPSHTDTVDGVNMTNFLEIAPGGELDSIAPDPDDSQIVFGGRVDRLNLRTGQTHSVDPTLAYPDLYRGTWTLPLVFSKAGSHALYFGNQRIFRSVDRGDHWDAISPDLTRVDPAVPANLDPTTVADHENPGSRRGVVYSLAPSPRDEKLIWAGTDDGLVWRTQDGGAHWQNVTPPALTAWSKVSAIDASHFDTQTVYISVDRHRLDDSRPYVFRSHDGGATWTPATDGIDDSNAVNSVNVVREDPVHRGLLYAGTERGVYVSFDDGSHWQPLQQNLPRTSVRDLEVHGDDLVIATHGRGFWIMDDVAPLRAFADDAQSATRLLPPAIAYRERPNGFLGTQLPRDEPLTENPPTGAYLDYVLDDSARDEVVIEVLDSRGAHVRTFSSRATWSAPDLAKVHTAPEWYPHPASVATNPGAHRIVWDLRGEPQPAFAPDDLAEAETTVWEPPGQYQVELRADGKAFRQPLTVLPDPRVTLAPAVYARQFALARDIERARLEIDAAIKEATQLHAAIVKRTKAANGGTAALLAATDAHLVEIADVASRNPWPDFTGAAPVSTAGLRYLEAAFKKLAVAVDGADHAPTADAEKSYVQHRAILTSALAAWTQFKATDLVQLNSALTAEGAPPLAP